MSAFGDAFFNLAVVWVVWSQTQSVLQTAVIQVLWHVSTVLLAPVAGVVADRASQRNVMVRANVVAGVTVASLATLVLATDHLPLPAAFLSILVLNALFTFIGPARASVMPDIVGRARLAAAAGMFSTARQTATLLGNASGGLVVATLGTAWALATDAGTFFFAALCVALALPRHRRVAGVEVTRRDASLLSQLREGWGVIADRPELRLLIALSLLINMTSFLGPLWPAIVQQRLGGDATAFGVLNACGVAGAMLGAMSAGRLERRLGAGRVVATG